MIVFVAVKDDSLIEEDMPSGLSAVTLTSDGQAWLVGNIPARFSDGCCPALLYVLHSVMTDRQHRLFERQPSLMKTLLDYPDDVFRDTMALHLKGKVARPRVLFPCSRVLCDTILLFR